MKFVIEHLSKSYDGRQVLKDIDFAFEEGKIYGLLGRNGAGKTTLFNCLNGDLRTDGGRFFFEEETGPKDAGPEDIGYVLSTPTVPEFMTGREFLKFFMDEPLTSLDVVVAEEMKGLLRSLKAGRVTIFSTHIMDLALDLCDEIVLLSHGVLEKVDKADLDGKEFKERILVALREEDHA